MATETGTVEDMEKGAGVVPTAPEKKEKVGLECMPKLAQMFRDTLLQKMSELNSDLPDAQKWRLPTKHELLAMHPEQNTPAVADSETQGGQENSGTYYWVADRAEGAANRADYVYLVNNVTGEHLDDYKGLVGHPAVLVRDVFKVSRPE